MSSREGVPTAGRARYFGELAGFCSIGAGVVHAGAVGLHVDHPATARVFVVLALAQVGAGLAMVLGPARWWRNGACAAVNAASVTGWVLTRTTGISWVDGLQTAESPQTADVLCAVLAAIACIAAVVPVVRATSGPRVPQPALMATIAAALTIPALWTGTSHVHDHHDDVPRESAFEITDDGVIVAKSTTTSSVAATTVPVTGVTEESSGQKDPTPSTTAPNASAARAGPVATNVPSTTVPAPSHTHSTTPEQRLAAQSGWPRPFDPAAGPDFDGVAGVTAEQFQRARNVINATATGLSRYADYRVAEAAGYRSIGDGALGYEHFIKWDLIDDGRVLDSNAPESLVYRVSGSTRVLVSAMYMARPGTSLNDPTLVQYAGPLMQWHIHDNLCFLGGRVVGITDGAGNCRFGSRDGILSPMVHVWIAAHPCGPFAAVEGVAAGVAQASDAERLDLCNRH